MASVVAKGDDGFEALNALFPVQPWDTGCGAGGRLARFHIVRLLVPLMDFRQDRDTLDRWAASKGPEGLDEYRAIKNARSIDDLPALAAML